MSAYLGIDGGGSKTTCVVGDDAHVLGSAMAGGSNIGRVGPLQARASIQQAIREACAAAGIGYRTVERTCIGLAGFSAPEVRDVAHSAVTEVVSGDVMVMGDMEIALEAAFGDSAGVVVVAGTGSIAYGRNENGAKLRVGGHGRAISDEGSGHWVGRTAFCALLDPKEHARGALLLTATQIALGVRSPQELVQVGTLSPPPNFADLFPGVCATAQAGDELAREILSAAGVELAKLADQVVSKLWPQNQLARVALVGGVFKYSPIVRRSFCHTLRDLRQNVTISLRVVDPVMGALWLARKGTCAEAHS